MTNTDIVNAALDLAHEALETNDVVRMAWSEQRLMGLLDLTARDGDAERCRNIISLLAPLVRQARKAGNLQGL